MEFIQEYSGAPEINGMLRTNEKLSPYQIKQMNALDDAFKKIPGVKEDIEIFRGVEDINHIPKVGSIFKDKGFMSTSLSKKAHKVVLEEMEDWAEKQISISIRVSKGTKVLPIQGKLSTGYFDYQNEGLLMRNSEFKVLSKTSSSVELQIIK